MVPNVIFPPVVFFSTLHLHSVFLLLEKWFLVSRWNLHQQELPDHHANVIQITEPTPNDAESEQSSHNTDSMTALENMPWQVGRPAIESMRWALLSHVWHLYEAFSVHVAQWLNHYLCHMMCQYLSPWCPCKVYVGLYERKMRIWCLISIAKYMSKGRDCRRNRTLGTMGFNQVEFTFCNFDKCRDNEQPLDCLGNLGFGNFYKWDGKGRVIGNKMI